VGCARDYDGKERSEYAAVGTGDRHGSHDLAVWHALRQLRGAVLIR
jgi:hypothetical protein